jgi:AAA domain
MTYIDPLAPGDHGDYSVKVYPPKRRVNGGTDPNAPPLVPEDSAPEPLMGLGEWDAGDDVDLPPPRAWLLGNVFCRGFMSSLLADGGVGKTALRYAQLLSLATGRSLTGDHVFQRCRVLIVSLEDDRNELKRRILAACLHHGVQRSELKGWLFLSAPGASAGKLMTTDKNGRLLRGDMAGHLEAVVKARNIDVVSLDPFVKAHSVEENNNSAIDDVVQVLTDIGAKHNIAVDVPHHTSKGPADPGNANRGRGASAMNNGGRLVYTLSTMSSEEAKAFGISEDQRRTYIRMDSAKVNITRHLGNAKWFRLIGVSLGNATELYPNGDEVQTVEPWDPPKIWDGLSSATLNIMLTEIDSGMPNGQRYSAANKADDRAAWRVVQKHCSDRTEAQCREIIRTWVKNGVLYDATYDDPIERKERKGLRFDTTKRPT